MKVLIVYKSLSGFTEKYARWIGEELDAECVSIKDLKKGMVNAETLVVFGGSLHAVGINGYKELKRKIGSNFRELVVFAVGASPQRDGVEDELRAKNFTTRTEKEIKLYYFRGGFNYQKLDFKNRLLMTLLKLKILRKKESERNGDEKGILASYEKPLDAARRENINELIGYLSERIRM